MTRVKICGIRTIEDALLAVKCGADAVGILVGQKHPSPDFVSPDYAREICRYIPPFVAATLVTHYDNIDDITSTLSHVHPTAIQICSELTASDLRVLKNNFPGVSFLKTYHVIDQSSLEYGQQYVTCVDGFLLDSKNPETGQVGGTGLTHDWRLSALIVQQYKLPVVLAGGLNPDNVSRAISIVRPFGVDVNSGVKNSSGFKDFAKVRDFVAQAKCVR